MVILLTGATHTGKTVLAQKLLEEYKYPYLSIDHLKMGLIRSGHCQLTAESSDQDLTEYLWPIVREITKTNIENGQNIIIEGCYIPFDYKKDFSEEYLKKIKFICLVFSENYIHNHFEDIKQYAGIIENRHNNDYCTEEMLVSENEKNIESCNAYGLDYIFIDDKYDLDWNFKNQFIIFLALQTAWLKHKIHINKQ